MSELPASCGPASTLSDDTLVTVLQECSGRLAMYGTKVLHDRVTECVAEVRTRLSRTAALRTHQPVTPAGGEVVGEVFVSERGYHSQIHDSVGRLSVGRHPLYLHPSVAGDVEPVAWQFRVQVGGSWLRWMPCTENLFDEIVEFGENRYRPAQARPLYTHPPVADAALDDARFEWLGRQMRSCTTYMDGSSEFDAASFAMRKHNLRGRTIREAIDAAMSEDAALNQRGGGIAAAPKLAGEE